MPTPFSLILFSTELRLTSQKAGTQKSDITPPSKLTAGKTKAPALVFLDRPAMDDGRRMIAQDTYPVRLGDRLVYSAHAKTPSTQRVYINYVG